MPVPKSVRKAARESRSAAPAPQPQESGSAPAASSGNYVLEIVSCKLKDGKRGVYRSTVGKDASGKTFWLALETEHKANKGDTIVLTGQETGTFGGDDGKPPFHKLKIGNIESIGPKPQPVQEELKFEGEGADEMQATLAGLVKRFGMARVLQGLSELSTS